MSDIPMPHELTDPPPGEYPGPTIGAVARVRSVRGRQTFSRFPRVRTSQTEKADRVRRARERADRAVDNLTAYNALEAALGSLPLALQASIRQRIRRHVERRPGQRLSERDVVSMAHASLESGDAGPLTSRKRRTIRRILERLERA